MAVAGAQPQPTTYRKQADRTAAVSANQLSRGIPCLLKRLWRSQDGLCPSFPLPLPEELQRHGLSRCLGVAAPIIQRARGIRSGARER